MTQAAPANTWFMEELEMMIKALGAKQTGASVDDILAERESRYGKFEDHAAISQGLKEVLHQAPKWRLLSSAQKESLEMIAHKMARMLNGDTTYLDNAVDIVGYAQLMLDTMEANKSSSLGVRKRAK